MCLTDTSAVLPNCLAAEVSCYRSVRKANYIGRNQRVTTKPNRQPKVYASDVTMSLLEATTVVTTQEAAMGWIGLHIQYTHSQSFQVQFSSHGYKHKHHVRAMWCTEYNAIIYTSDNNVIIVINVVALHQTRLVPGWLWRSDDSPSVISNWEWSGRHWLWWMLLLLIYCDVQFCILVHFR